MRRPTPEARRTAHKRPEDPPEGLDARLEALLGRRQRGQRLLPPLQTDARAAEALAPTLATLSDARLRTRLQEHRDIFRRGGPACDTHQEVLALAAIREAATRTLGLTPFLEQLTGALALRRGHLAEMATGEGKSLTAVLAAILNAWSGRPCHIITVNDYLAARDPELLGKLYRFCGASVASVTGPMSPAERREGYAADVTYTTSKEVVADFLRDRLRLGPLQDPSRRLLQQLLSPRQPLPGIVMRGLHSAIIDEADSVLIDEAVTPLLISEARENPELEAACRIGWDLAAAFLPQRHYQPDFAARDIRLLPAGEDLLAERCGELPGIWRAPKRREELLRRMLSAREFFHRDQQYVVQDGEVVIVDEFTGRMMPGRTWREGLHQAVQAKENLPVTAPTETLARISFQRYFRLYPRLAGMTGTAMEAAPEFWQIYRLPVVPIPTHKPCIRVQHPDHIFLSAADRDEALIRHIHACHREGLPVLVGTRHISSSEALARRLDALGLPYNLLHAIHHREEARIVAEAGRAGCITLATNMAGRGTDILLERGVAERGGLRVFATERHESARIDRQLFGRCARQGDPGEVRVFVSLEDELFTRYLPSPLRKTLRILLLSGHPAGQRAVAAALALAQKTAGVRAARQRAQVLKTDRWIADSLAFVTPMGP